MSCSSNRNRLVGSCIKTLVSSTNSLVAVDGPDFAGLREGRRCSVDGAGRSLRSTMGLQRRERTARRYLAPETPGIQAIVVAMSMQRKGLWWKADRRLSGTCHAVRRGDARSLTFARQFTLPARAPTW